MSIMSNGACKDVIDEAERCFMRGKPGTFAVARTPEGKLWYTAPGVQTPVILLRLRICENTYDERSFAGILIIRADRKKRKYWFVFYNPYNKNASYIASSADEYLDCTCSIVAEAPNISGCINEAIVVQAVFETYGKMVSRIQSDDMAQVLLLQAHLADEKSDPVVTGSNNLHDQHGTECGLNTVDIDSLLDGGEERQYEYEHI